MKREVKYIFKELGYTVLELHRLSYANITVSNLRIGGWRLLKEEEVNQLKKMVGLYEDA